MKVLIVEDEHLAAQKLEKLIKEYDENIEVVEQLDSILATVNWLNSNQTPDLIFQDIHLADGSAFEIYEQVKVKTPVIFTTAYDQYAIEAFKVNSIDYLLKPIKPENLARSMDKLKELRPSSKKPAGSGDELEKLLQFFHEKNQSYKTRFLVKSGNLVRSIPIEEVGYFFTEDRLVILVTRENRKFAVNYTLDEIEQIIDPEKFIRFNRQFLSSFESVDEIHPYFKGRLKINLKPRQAADVVVSSERAAFVKEWLGK